MRRIFLLVLLLGSSLTGIAQTIRHVPADYPTIQGAINASVNGDTVLVAPGTYKERLTIDGKNLTLQSEAGPEFTTIDAEFSGRVLKITNNSTSTVRGFTLTNGLVMNADGGGIWILNSAAVIENNVITGNASSSWGAGIYVNFSSVQIRKNRITKNTSVFGGYGAGIMLGGLSPGTSIIEENEIAENVTAGSGGGIGFWSGGNPIIRNNVIRGNQAQSGAGIYMVNSSSPLIVQNLIIENDSYGSGGGIYWLTPSGERGPFLLNNTIANNNAQFDQLSSAIYAGGYDKNVRIANNILVGKSGLGTVYCDDFNDLNTPIFTANIVFTDGAASFNGFCVNPLGADGNAQVDPLFVDPAANNYHLQSNSPAIDAAIADASIPAFDLDLVSRNFDGDGNGVANSDIGVFEFHPGTPVVQVSPPVLSFGAQDVNSVSSPQVVTVINNGDGLLTMSSIVAPSAFPIVGSCNPYTGLAPGASCSTAVRFKPTSAGPQSGDLSYATNAPASPHLVALSGVGVSPVPVFDPLSLSFAAQPFNVPSLSQSVSLTNTGDRPLVIQQINTTAEFSQANDCPGTLAIGANCTFQVQFIPLGNGVRTGSLQLVSNAAGSPHSVSLSGTGQAGEATFLPAALNFGAVSLFASKTLPVILQNTGSGPLTISSIITSGPFSPAHDCPLSLPGGASCTIEVQFIPTNTQSYSSTLSVSTNVAGSPHQVSLTGTGVFGSIFLSPNLFDFGVQAIGTTVTQVFFLVNTFDFPATVLSHQLYGDFVYTNDCPQTLDFNQICTFSVTYAPTVAGNTNGELSVQTSSGNVFATLQASAAAIAMTPNRLAFSARFVGSSTTKTTTFYNQTTSPINIQDIGVVGNYTFVSHCGTLLAANSTCDIDVTFTPAGTGTRNGSLTITDDGSGSPRTVFLTGRGTLPNVSLDPVSVDFGTQLVGTTTDQTIAVANNSIQPFTIEFQPSGSGFALSENNCPFSLAPASACEVKVSFSPSASGAVSGLLQIVVNGAPLSAIPLSGIGVSEYPQPAITALTPPSAPVGSEGFTLQVQGSGFFSNSIIRWDGIDLQTTYVSPTRLTALIPPSFLADFIPVDVTVINPNPGGGASGARAFILYRTVDVLLNDIVYDKYTRKIFGAGAGNSPTAFNTIIGLDPLTAQHDAGVFIGGDPSVLSLSDDGTTLYAGLRGRASVAKIDIPSATSNLEFTVGADAFFGPKKAEDIAIMPGAPNTIAVSMYYEGVSPRHAGVAMFDDGVPRNLQGPVHTGSNAIEFGASRATLFGYNNETTEFGFRTMSVAASGLTVTNVDSTIIGGFGTNMRYQDGQMFVTSGRIFDPVSRTILGQLPEIDSSYSSFVEPDTNRRRVFAAFTPFGQQSAIIKAYDANTFEVVGSGALANPGVAFDFQYISDMVRWGNDGLALLNREKKLFLFRTSMTIPPNTAQPFYLTDMSSVYANRTNQTFTISGSNFVRGATIMMDGTELSTDFISPTQLRGYLSAADTANAATHQFIVINPNPDGGDSLPLTRSFVPFSASPAVLNFAPTMVFNTSANHAVTIQSQSDSPTPIAITITGEFEVAHNCGTMLAPHASCVANVSFKPTVSAVSNGTLAITTNGIGWVADLHGTGVDITLNLARPGRPRRNSQGATAAKKLVISSSQPLTGVSIACRDASGNPCTISPGVSDLTPRPQEFEVRFRRSSRLGRSSSNVVLTISYHGQTRVMPVQLE